MAKEAATGPQAQVTSGPLPQVEVEILPDVHAFIEGKPVAPGKKAYVDGPSAVHLVALGHAKITGSR